MLSGYFDKAFQEGQMPISLEQVFKIRLTDNLKMGGKIDRVDEIDHGKLEIIDYKTGKKPKDKEIENSLQMTVYALAAKDKGIFNKKPEDLVLSFYFFSTQEKISTSRNQNQINEAKSELIRIAQEINESSFPATPGKWCDFCDFRMVCDAWK